MEWKPHRTERLATGLFFEFDRMFFRDDAGNELPRDVIRHRGGVSVLPVDGETITLIRQHRVAVGANLLEAPAGKLEHGEDPRVAAQRECVEEVGLEPITLIDIGPMETSPGFTDEIIHLYIADGVKRVDVQPEGAEEQDAEIVEMSLVEAVAAIEAGEISDAKTRVLILTAIHRQDLRDRGTNDS